MPTIFQQIKKEIANKYKDELAEARNQAVEARNELAKAREGMAKIARKLMEKGMDIDTIIEVTGISREKLEKIDSTVH